MNVNKMRAFLRMVIDNRFGKNAVFSSISSATRLAVNAVLFVLIARFYGPETFGQFTTAHTLATVFTLFADFGFDLFLSSTIAGHPEKSAFLLPRMLGIKLIFSLGATAMMVGYALTQMPSESTSNLALLFSFYVLLSALTNFFFALFKGFEDLKHEMRVTLVMNILLLIMLVILGFRHADIVWVSVTFVASRIVGLFLALRLSRGFVQRVRPLWDLQWLKSVWKNVAVFGMFFVFGNLFFSIDTIMLSKLRGDYEVGMYQSVFRLITVMLVIPEIAIAVVLAPLMKYYAADQTGWQQLGATMSKTLYFLGLIIGLVTTVSPGLLINLVYGGQFYLEAANVLRIFGVIVALRYSFAIPAVMLTTSGQQQRLMTVVVAATIFNVLLNLYAIPLAGPLGAAIVSLVTNAFVLVAISLSLQGHFIQSWLTSGRIIPLVAAIIGGLLLVRFPALPEMVGLFLVVLLLIGIITLMGYSKADREILLGGASVGVQ